MLVELNQLEPRARVVEGLSHHLEVFESALTIPPRLRDLAADAPGFGAGSAIHGFVGRGDGVLQRARTAISPGSSAGTRAKDCSMHSCPSSNHARPTRKAMIPEPARPVVSVSR